MLKVDTPADQRNRVGADELEGVEYPDGVWSVRVHDRENITVDAVFNVRNPPFVQGIAVNQPTLSWRFPEYA